jgi:hypothetical protein
MERPLEYPPTFDSRVVCYPTLKAVRDYISWRQVDCHINNLYNTCFWALVLLDGRTEAEAEAALRVTKSDDKNELLFSKFGKNYNLEPAIFRKGSIIYRALMDVTVESGCVTPEATSGGSSTSSGREQEVQMKGDGKRKDERLEGEKAEGEERREGTIECEGEGEGEGGGNGGREGGGEKEGEGGREGGGEKEGEGGREGGGECVRTRKRKRKQVRRLVVCHDDVISDSFWSQSPNILLETARDSSKCFGSPPSTPSTYC